MGRAQRELGGGKPILSPRKEPAAGLKPTTLPSCPPMDPRWHSFPLNRDRRVRRLVEADLRRDEASRNLWVSDGSDTPRRLFGIPRLNERWHLSLGVGQSEDFRDDQQGNRFGIRRRSDGSCCAELARRSQRRPSGAGAALGRRKSQNGGVTGSPAFARSAIRFESELSGAGPSKPEGDGSKT